MVQLPVENERKEEDKNGGRRLRRGTGIGPGSAEALHSPGRSCSWKSRVTPFAPTAPGLKSPSPALLCQPSIFFP